MATTITPDVCFPKLTGYFEPWDLLERLQKSGKKQTICKIGREPSMTLRPKCREANPVEFARNDPKHSPATKVRNCAKKMVRTPMSVNENPGWQRGILMNGIYYIYNFNTNVL